MLRRQLSLAFVVVFIVLIGIRVDAISPAVVTSPFHYSFNVDGTLNEAGGSLESTSPYWWLNSGAKLILASGTGKTAQGALSFSDPWRLLYLAENPIDTDSGYHPQNIFRLVTRSKWKNFAETAYFKINKDQLSSSPNRDAHNGLLLMSRYQNGNNLYYAGIRVDGKAIIKKKLNGQYYTLAEKKIFSGTYNRVSKPSLLPKNTWIGLKSYVTTIGSKVNIKLYMDQGKTGVWTLILEANDAGQYGSLIINAGYAGIRTDFMDVEFDDFSIIESL